MYAFVSKQINQKYQKKTLIENYKKILITMSPVVPHFSNECLSLMGFEDNSWPKYNENLIKEEKIEIVIQINGKKRGLIKSKVNQAEENIVEIAIKDEKLSKYLDEKNIKKNLC